MQRFDMNGCQCACFWAMIIIKLWLISFPSLLQKRIVSEQNLFAQNTRKKDACRCCSVFHGTFVQFLSFWLLIRIKGALFLNYQFLYCVCLIESHYYSSYHLPEFNKPISVIWNLGGNFKSNHILRICKI